MVYINEWLPNPAGADSKGGEFIELYNNGAVTVRLDGWTLRTDGAGKARLNGAIGAGEYLVLERSATKLVLRNTDEKLFLYDANGALADASGFLGAAVEGESFSRVDHYNGPAQHFVWADPTPGAANSVSLDTIIVRNAYPAGVPLTGHFGIMAFAGLMLASALAITALVMFALKKHEDLSKLFFARDEEIW